MTSTNRFIGCCFGAALGDSLGMSAEGLTPAKIKNTYGEITGFVHRTETATRVALSAKTFTDQTEALLAVLTAARPLPDLMNFSFHLKKAFEAHPEKWPKPTTFAWPPFPDESHYTLALSIPVAHLLFLKKIQMEDVTVWFKKLSPVSLVWQQALFVYLHLLLHLFHCSSPETFSPQEYWNRIQETAQEAERLFPGDNRLTKKLIFLTPLLQVPLSEIAKACGKVGTSAHDMLGFISAAFYTHHQSFYELVLPAINMGGASDASGFYLGSLFGALWGIQGLPAGYDQELHESGRLQDSLAHFLNAL